MTFPRPVVLGNWKMNGLRADGLALAGDLAGRVGQLSGTLGLFPPATILSEIAGQVKGTAIVVGGQDCHEEKSGAYTGSISAAMLKDAGAAAVILGHSERRHGLAESDELVCRKVRAALAEDLLAVVCIGETEEEWQSGKREDVLRRQLRLSLPDAVTLERLILAYEPVWAIGTGRTPTLEDIDNTHAFIRRELLARFPGSESVPILYGGSVKPENAQEILGLASVDGALVGGASLKAGDFWTIYRAGGGA
jgi:triosephosphate isomerase (TIM)